MLAIDEINMFLPSLAGGGAERVFVHLANKFADKGRKVRMVLLRKEGPYLQDLDQRITVVDLRASNQRGVIALAKFLRRERPCVLIAAPDKFNVIALIANWLAGRRCHVITTNHLPISVYSKNSKGAFARFLPLLVRRLYPSAAAMVGVSHGITADLARITGLPCSRIVTIYNPVVVRPCSMSENAHPWFNDTVPVIVSAGRLVPEKDFPTLLTAFSRVVPNRLARLIILGEGSERNALEIRIAELGLEGLVELKGFVSDPFSYFARAKLFVLSARYEGFGMVIAEALSCGCPVVSTDCPTGPAEILAHGRYGALVPVGDSVALSKAMLYALDRVVDRDSLRRRAAEFDVDHAAERYLRLVDQVCSSASPSARL